ncbi:MAG TPA: universal stress protein [Aurantimonas sp.]|uniref:Universal stress protein n=1 Tax=Aurantimonas marianensis TaxID=2920428 RepID=A0A9X2HF91_9HYPH|nr:universal stress protein [Aurantimonas marianensis]MCP3056509.1 universal stress protein [Aurantimonas marianensis]
MFKTILVCLGSKDRTEALLDVAVPLAERHDAHLVGLHVIPSFSNYAGGMTPAEVPVEFFEENRRSMQAEAEAIERVFAERTRAAGVRNEWRRDEATSPNQQRVFNRHAMCADLVIAGQARDTEWGGGSILVDLIMGSGRPVLLIPYAGRFSRIGERVMLTWNATREAARAAFDALPILKDASHVRVLAVDPSGDRSHSGLAPADDLAVALARHGIKAQAATSFSDTISVADDILSRLADDGSDLLVMGCFGHSRVRETLFGGVTRHVLRHMTVPVLMSH